MCAQKQSKMANGITDMIKKGHREHFYATTHMCGQACSDY